MAAGRVRIYKRIFLTEGGRREEQDPELYHEAWCEISSLYGQELYKALEIRLENTMVFQVRYCRKIREIQQHLKEFFLEYQGERYDIFAIDFRRNERQYVQLKANRTD